MQPHPDVVALVLGELGGHGQPGDCHGGGVGGEVGAHGDRSEGRSEEENGEESEEHPCEETVSN